MVKGTATLLAILGAFFAQGVRAAEVPAYRIGDVATNDVVTTTGLLVVDNKATTEIRNREAQKIDLFVVYSTNHAAFIENRVRSAVARMRGEFLGLLQATYGTDRLVPEVVDSQGFRDLVQSFLYTSPGPPVSREIVVGWAEGQTNDSFLDEWLPPLRQVMAEPIRPEQLSGGVEGAEHRKLRLVAVRDLGTYVKERFALSNSVAAYSSDLIPFSTVQSNLLERLRKDDARVAFYMVTQLQPNCRVDTNLTQRVKSLVVSGLVQMKHFEPGEVVVRKGRVIDEEALAALAEMRKSAKVSSLEQQVAVNQVAVQLLSERNLWLAGLLGGTGLVLVLVLLLSHRRKRRELVPVLSSSFVDHGAEEALAEATVVDVPPSQGEWQRRALEAERRMERVSSLARSNLMPHLAQQLKDTLVQQLAAQVDDMLDVQVAVADQLASMEERLDRLHAPLQERLRLYEKRISELELDLAQRGQENQLLLRARIEALRWQMEQEKSDARVK